MLNLHDLNAKTIRFNWLRACAIGLFGGFFLAALGCGGAADAFSVSYPDNREGDIGVLLARLKQAPPRIELPVAVGVTQPPLKLYAFDLMSKQLLWRTPTATITTPVVVGDAVVTTEGESIWVRDLRSGARRFAIKTEGQALIGTDAYGDLLVITLAKGSGQYADSRVIAVREDDVVWQQEFQGMAGAPAVVGDVVLVPWNHQNLSALEAADGREFARLRVRDAVIGRAFADRGSVYAGSQYGVVRLTEAIRSGWAKRNAFYAPPEKKLPGQPNLLQDAYSPTPVPLLRSGQNHVRLSWLPTVVDEKTIGLQDENLYLVFYKFIVGFDPSNYNVHWIYTHPADISGAATVPGGILFADEEGEVGFISASNGEKLWNAPSGLSSMVVEVRASQAPIVSTGGATISPDMLRDQFLAAAQHDDDRLVPVRMLMVEHLTKLADPAATGALIELCDSPSNSPLVRKASCDALESRDQGAEYILGALQRHAAFLEGTHAPPVGPLAKAAAKLKERRAVAPLIAHLRDPNTSSQDLEPLVKALAQLEDRAAVEPLRDFIRLYHADPVDPYIVDGLSAALTALYALSGPAATDLFTEVANDELGISAVRARALITLDQLDRERAAAEQKQEQEQKSQQQEAQAEKDAAIPKAVTPARLTLAVVDRVLAPVQKKLKACLKFGGTQLFSARVLLVVNEGKVSTVAVTPDKLQGCIEPLIREPQYPVTLTHKKEQLFYTISVR
jgi:outer membrane protein assembly factor BamB/antitoxin component of MazEF toxin-antitoxin module